MIEKRWGVPRRADLKGSTSPRIADAGLSRGSSRLASATTWSLFDAVMGRVRVLRRGRGRPRTGPARSDKASRASRRGRGIRATIPQPADQQANRARRRPRGGRPPSFDAVPYKQRNVVERCVNKLKHHRALTTRYNKREYRYQGTVDVASIRVWLRDSV